MTDLLRRLYLDAFDPASIQEWILDHDLRILIILILAVVVYRIFDVVAAAWRSA